MIVHPVLPEAWEIADQMLPIIRQLDALNQRLCRLQMDRGGAKPVPFHPVDLENAIRNLKK